MEQGAVTKYTRWAFYQFAKHLCRSAAMALTGVRHFNVPAREVLEGGVLVASNHQSFLDPVLVGMALPGTTRYAARSGLFKAPGFGQLIRLVGASPLKRGQLDRSGWRRFIAILNDGEPLLMFPEGTRSRDGELGRFRKGAASLAIRCGVPVLPVCVEGAFYSWPRHRLLPQPARAAVAYGTPVSSQGRDSEELMEQVKHEISELQGFLRAYLGAQSQSE